MIDRDVIHPRHAHCADIYYDNGCVLCDSIAELHDIAEHGAQVPWADEDYDQEQAALLIRRIQEYHGVQT